MAAPAGMAAPAIIVKAASAEWDEYAGSWDSMAGPTSHWACDSHEKVMQIIGKRQMRRVLDFGAGTGVMGLALRSSLHGQGLEEVVFHDVAPKMLQEISRKIEAGGITKATVSTFTEDIADASASTLAGPFDLIVSGSVLTFVPDAHATLRALRDRLTPGTGVCFPDAEQPACAYSTRILREVCEIGHGSLRAPVHAARRGHSFFTLCCKRGAILFWIQEQ
jgi:2-polyprenyl-3-methyl-5-hydroxy-6-metoxy-1,4-benzoquinol methylase